MDEPLGSDLGDSFAIPSECACGCGTPINAGPLAVDELRRAGLTYRAIAADLHVSAACVKQRRRQVALWAPGHRAGGRWVEMACVRCGKAVRKPATMTKPPHCSGICVPLEEWYASNCASYDLTQARVNATIRSTAAVLRGEEPSLVDPVDARARLTAWLSAPTGDTADEMIAGVLATAADEDFAAAESVVHWLAEGRPLLWICETLGSPPADVCRLIARVRAQSRAASMSASS